MYCRKTRYVQPVLFQTINHDNYKGVLQCICDTTQHCCPELWATAKWFLLHDNVRPGAALSVTEFLSVHQIAVLSHVPYPQDFCDFFLIPMTETSTERPPLR